MLYWIPRAQPDGTSHMVQVSHPGNELPPEAFNVFNLLPKEHWTFHLTPDGKRVVVGLWEHPETMRWYEEFPLFDRLTNLPIDAKGGSVNVGDAGGRNNI
jgi:hypothetical protein